MFKSRGLCVNISFEKFDYSKFRKFEFDPTLIQIDMMGNVLPLTSSSDTGYMSYVC